MMKEAQTIRDRIDNLHWLAGLNTREGHDRALAYAEDIRRNHGPGWWDATLASVETRARMALGLSPRGCPRCGRDAASPSSNLCGDALMGRPCKR